MLRILYYLATYFLLWQSPAAAFPQGASQSSQFLPTLAAASTTSSATIEATLISANSQPQPKHTLLTNASVTDHSCDFETMEAFFDYAAVRSLNITREVQKCQSLCLLTYGVGNPDLSGIGMMYSYSIQIGLTIFIGPFYRLLFLLFIKNRKGSEAGLFLAFIKDLKSVQDIFFASNGFFVLACAVASFVSLSKNPAIFEIAEMQALAFLQVNSILVIFFCLVKPLSRWNPRVWLHGVVFVVVIVVLGKSQLSSSRRVNWRLASNGCAHESTDYGVITPVPYPSWAVAIFAVAGMLGFWVQVQSLKKKFQTSRTIKVLFGVVVTVWVLLIGLMIAGMIFGLAMVWRQRNHLRSVAGEKFKDDVWGFGQVAALFVWAPFPLSFLHAFWKCAQKRADGYWTSPIIKYFLGRKVNQKQADILESKEENIISTTHKPQPAVVSTEILT